jgi:iron complex outermembrane receptor protein
VVSPYAQEYLTLGTRLSLVGGLRGDFYSDGRSTVVPRVAAIYQATRRTTLKLLYGDAIRVPTALEDVAVSRDPGATTLVAERLKTLEAIWDQRLAPWLQGSLSVFVYDSDNLIDERTDSATFQISYTNRSRVNVKGLEVTARSSLPSGFHGYAGLELVRTVDEATQRRLTNSPASMLKLGVSRPVLEIDVAAEVRHEAGRLNAHGGATAPFTLANLTLTRRPGSSDVPRSNAFAQRVEFMLQVRNLFDQTYRVPAALSSSQKSILQDRRSVLVRLGYRF